MGTITMPARVTARATPVWCCCVDWWISPSIPRLIDSTLKNEMRMVAATIAATF